MLDQLDRVAVVGGVRIPFCRSNTFYADQSNLDMMAAALGVINFDENVKSIFINIFGGITRGEEVAKGIVAALGRVELRAPIVIRLDGTNADEGRAILKPHLSSRLMLEPTMLDAARKAVALAAGKKAAPAKKKAAKKGPKRSQFGKKRIPRKFPQK